MQTGLESQTVIVTGGARGIGLATAKHFANAGCNVVVWDVAFDEKEQGGFKPALQQKVDVTSLPSIEKAFGEVVTRFGKV